MERREFLKLSALTAIWIAANPNSLVTEAFSNAKKFPDKKVMLFLAKKLNGDSWFVSGTLFIDLDRKKLRRTKWDFDSFKILGIYDDSEATKMRNKFWTELVGPKIPTLPLLTHEARRIGFEQKEKNVFGTPGCKAVVALLESGYLQSEKNKTIFREIGLKQGKINSEKGHMKNMQKALFESGYPGSELQKKYSSMSGKIVGPKQGKINAENGHMNNIQKIGATLGGKAMAEKYKSIREEREKKLYDHLPQKPFSMKELISLAKQVGIPSNLKFSYHFRDLGYITMVHKGINGSAINFDLYLKNQYPPLQK